MNFQKYHSANWNGVNAISISCHPNNIQLINKYNLNKSNDNAFKEFIYPNVSLVLDESLIENFELKQDSWKMNYELHVIGDIPINYIIAIAVNYSNYKTYNINHLYRLKKILLERNNHVKGKYFCKYSDEIWYLMLALYDNELETQLYRQIPYIYELKNVINEYNLNIPIIDLQYGYILPEEVKVKKLIKDIKKQFAIYRNIPK